MKHELSQSIASPHAAVAAVDGEEIFQLVKRGDIDPREVEEVGSNTIEVSVLWDRAILHVAHLEPGRSFVLASSAPVAKPTTPALLGGLAAGSTLIATSAATGNYVVGAIGTAMALAGAGAGIFLDQRNQESRREGSRFVVDAAVIGGASEMPVVRMQNGTARFVFPKDAQGEVETDGAKRTIAQLVADGSAHAMTDGSFEMELRGTSKYRVTLGSLTIMARVVARARRVAGASRRDPATIWAGLGAAGAVATILTGAFLATSADSALLTADNHDAAMSELQRIMSFSHERAPQETRHEETNADTRAQAESGRASRGTEGSMGRRDSSQRNRRYQIARANAPLSMARESAREQVRNRGIFIGLGSAGGAPSGGSGPTSPWGSMMESGMDDQSFNGNMDGELPGDAYGNGGLGRVGTGFGGGGDGENTIGTGVMGTFGHGDGNEHVAGARGNHLHDRENTGPRVRVGTPESVGTMSPEAIRRVVLRNLGQVQHCHEQGLAQNPALAGRVVVRFVIGGDGLVIGSRAIESSLSVPSVAECIAHVASRWQFTAPEGGGAVTVTYPFTLQPPQ